MKPGDIVRVNDNYPPGNMDPWPYQKFGTVYQHVKSRIWVNFPGKGCAWFYEKELDLICLGEGEG